jgi:NAD(P)-dependent dehydrogenase (short-subunit alcohol dehydrogenase family)
MTWCYAFRQGRNALKYDSLGGYRLTTATITSGARYDKHFPERLAATSTVRRTLGQPDDIGRMIASLLAEYNRWINGQRIEASSAISL